MKCEICGRECRGKVGLGVHKSFVHKIKSIEYNRYIKGKENKNKCLECGKEYTNLGSLSRHISKGHKIQLKDYYNKYLIKDGEGRCINFDCENKTRFNGLNGYSRFCSFKCIMRNKEIIQKRELDSLNKYGFKYSTQCKEVKEKTKHTMIKKYGFDNIFKNIKYIKECCIKKWNVDNWAKTKQGKEFHREDTWKRIEDQKFHEERPTPCVGPEERLCLNIIQLRFNNYIDRQPNIGGYFPDGRILHLRLLIEFDEERHYIDGYSKDDLNRESYLVSQGYIMFRIKQDDWKNNREKIIEQFKNLVQILSEEYYQ